MRGVLLVAGGLATCSSLSAAVVSGRPRHATRTTDKVTKIGACRASDFGGRQGRRLGGRLDRSLWGL